MIRYLDIEISAAEHTARRENVFPAVYRGTSLIRTPPPVGPYSSPMPGVPGGPMGDGVVI